MAFCSKCGAQVGEGDLFCSTCGAKAAAPEVATPPVFDIERKGQQIDEVGRHQMVALIAGAVGVVLIIVGLALGLITRTHIHQFAATVYEHHPYRNISLGLGAGGALVAFIGFGKGLYYSIKSRRLLKDLRKQK
jgi:amino acid transporter